MSAARSAIRVGLTGITDDVDLVVIGLGVTGAGVALDAVSRGMKVLAVDAHDLAFGTSRWSSKLVHGGLRYLASGQFGVAHESAVERGILMQTTAPHLTKPMGTLVPLTSRPPMIMRAGLLAGDVLRWAAGTSGDLLPAARQISTAQAVALAPALRREGLRSGMLGWDGQLVDDARLVLTIARSAARLGAQIRTRARFTGIESGVVVLKDELSGQTHRIAARAVINAGGVWSGKVAELFPTAAPPIKLKPSRGSHLVLKPTPDHPLARQRVAVMVPVPGSTSRFTFVLPQADGTAYVGLTDEPTGDEIPEVPQASEVEVGFLLDVVSAALQEPIRRQDVVGTFAGLRPLLDAAGETADLSRKHAVIDQQAQGLDLVTVVGGKLTTYRRMAQDALDILSMAEDFDRCSTANLPLSGALPREDLTQLRGPRRLIDRYGADHEEVLSSSGEVSGLSEAELLEPISAGIPTTLAELIYGVTHEGAHSVDDLLERRTRVALVPVDRVKAEASAQRALTLCQRTG